MIELLNTHSSDALYIYNMGLILSLLIRFTILTSCVFISNNTRLKELKNLTNRAARGSLKKSYMSILWPAELIVLAVYNIRYFLNK